mgnify:FL=1
MENNYLMYNENVTRVEATILKVYGNTLETNKGWISKNYTLQTHPINVGDKVMARNKFIKHFH